MAKAKEKPTEDRADRTLVITRVFDAPRDVVFDAWTDPEKAGKWWGPKGFTLTHREMDVRPGGRWRVCMHSPDGVDHWAQGVYREIVAPERFVYTWAWEKPKGTPGRETLVTVELAEQGRKTKMTFRQAEFETVEDRESHRGGWSESFDLLAEFLATGGKDAKEEVGMLGDKPAIATIAVKSVEAAGKFYEGKLGLKPLPVEQPRVRSYKSGDSMVLVYESEFAGTNKATAATWAVGKDVDGVVRALKAKGVAFEKYDFPGITREGDVHVMGKTRAAWFKDPDGNILSIVNQ